MATRLRVGNLRMMTVAAAGIALANNSLGPRNQAYLNILYHQWMEWLFLFCRPNRDTWKSTGKSNSSEGAQLMFVFPNLVGAQDKRKPTTTALSAGGAILTNPRVLFSNRARDHSLACTTISLVFSSIQDFLHRKQFPNGKSLKKDFRGVSDIIQIAPSCVCRHSMSSV